MQEKQDAVIEDPADGEGREDGPPSGRIEYYVLDEDDGGYDE